MIDVTDGLKEPDSRLRGGEGNSARAAILWIGIIGFVGAFVGFGLMSSAECADDPGGLMGLILATLGGVAFAFSLTACAVALRVTAARGVQAPRRTTQRED